MKCRKMKILIMLAIRKRLNEIYKYGFKTWVWRVPMFQRHNPPQTIALISAAISLYIISCSNREVWLRHRIRTLLNKIPVCGLVTNKHLSKPVLTYIALEIEPYGKNSNVFIQENVLFYTRSMPSWTREKAINVAIHNERAWISN